MTQQIAALPHLQLDAASNVPLYYQLYEGIRSAILAGQLAANTRLRASRALAKELCVSRTTVMEAYSQLFAEGYIEGKIGSGTYVSHTLPDTVLHISTATNTAPARQARSPSRRGKLAGTIPTSLLPDRGTPRAFRLGLPAFDTFPFDIWARLMSRCWRKPPPELLAYGEPEGLWPLRGAIAECRRASLGIRCM